MSDSQSNKQNQGEDDNNVSSSIESNENYPFRLNDEESEPQSSTTESMLKAKKQSWRQVLMLGFSSLGAIYGDIGTSPLYVLNSIKYPNSSPTEEDIYGAISIIFYLFTFIVIFKYILIVLFLGTNDGEGGQVAIYAKIARSLKIGPKGVHIPGSPEKTDLELLARAETSSSFKSSNLFLNKASGFKTNPKLIKFISKFILFGCFFGCSLVMSDGLLTPTTSVLSAIAGIQIANPSFNDVLAVSEVVLIVLFLIQQFGSNKISFTFAPIIFLWLIGLIISGIYNIVKFHPAVFKSLSPYYAIQLLKHSGIDVFSGAMLSITGTEAMFADVGHFGRLPIQLTLTLFVYPALIICYLGQGAYIIKHPEALSNPFFYSIPGGLNSWIYWVMFVLATLSTIIASQALILGVFSITSQLINLDCFPNFKIIHVSKKYAGKVYIPAINWLLMIGVCATTAGFKNSNNVTAAYGLGITLDFLVTSSLIMVCMTYVYNWNILIPITYALIFLPLEVIMVISNLKKITHGAWFPLMMSGIFMMFLSFWRWARSRKVNQDFKTRIRIGDLYPELKKQPPQSETVDLNDRGRPMSIVNSSNEELVEYGVTLPKILKTNNNQLKVQSKFGLMNLKKYDGIAIMYNDSSVHTLNSPNTVPQVYGKLVSSFSSIPSVFIFCSIRVLSIPTVPNDERVLIGSMKIPGHYRCIIRYGFMEEILIDKELNNHILNSIPDINELAIKFNLNNKCILTKPCTIPILHIFENNLIRSHDYSSEEHETKNPLVKCKRFIRKILINHIFSPIYSDFQSNGKFLKISDEDEESEKKMFLGGVVRI
uniref:High affinity potassium transporter n=1 Tax=Schwanniomyces occidentalis TaxID=27300 RepID=HAK1_SCHOC|nr:RecName: Full=High affinity potassium transporter [Schwanniomyces occidentalis]AAB17122.2 high affinity potassium transporter [Schwanniomyces occidentalis]